jgi:hypothetical protein
VGIGAVYGKLERRQKLNISFGESVATVSLLELDSRQHYVQCPSICQLCEDEVEDDWHVMFGCEESEQSWAAAGLSTVIESRLSRFNEAKALIHDICHNEEREVAGRFAVMIWMLWSNRNDWL